MFRKQNAFRREVVVEFVGTVVGLVDLVNDCRDELGVVEVVLQFFGLEVFVALSELVSAVVDESVVAMRSVIFCLTFPSPRV